VKAAVTRTDRKRKITVRVSTDLLARAQQVSGAGISETVRQGLEALVAKWAYGELLKLKGKVKFSVDLDELRKDRRLNW
jgi:hypothetical protein